MTRRWVGECRYCDTLCAARSPRAWLRWYHEHLRACAPFRARERASRPEPLPEHELGVSRG